MARKQPLSFTLDAAPATPEPVTSPQPAPRATPKAAGSSLKQVGARIPETLYRELKAHAALKGERVQAVLETAITDYLHRQGREP